MEQGFRVSPEVACIFYRRLEEMASPVGLACTIAEAPSAGWNLTEIFCDGSGNWTMDLAQARVTVTLASSQDFVYCRFTNRRVEQPVGEGGLLGLCWAGLVLAVVVMAAFQPRSGGKATARP